MGFIDAVKGIIAKFREAGKTENEISGIIETAAEKATVGGRCKEVNYERIWIDGIPYKVEVPKRCEAKAETNNWHKMHGLPMRRKQKARKRHERRKRADCHRQNAHISRKLS